MGRDGWVLKESGEVKGRVRMEWDEVDGGMIGVNVSSGGYSPTRRRPTRVV